MKYTLNPLRDGEIEISEPRNAMKETHTAEMIDMQTDSSLFTDDPRATLRQAAARAGMVFHHVMNAARLTLSAARSLALLTVRLIVWLAQPRQLRRAVACLLMLAIFTDSNKALGHAIFNPASGKRLLDHTPVSLPARSQSGGFLSSLASGFSTVATAFETVFDLLFPFDEEPSRPKTKSISTPTATASLRLPRIESVDVKDDSRSGLARVVIRGSNFRDQSLVAAGERELQVVRASFDQIIALAPHTLRQKIDAGRASIRVINPDARQSSWIKNATESGEEKFSYTLSPVRIFFPASTEPVFQSPVQQISAAISQRTPSLNTGRIEGQLRVFEGAQWNINGGFQLTADMFVVGTPDIRLNGNASYGGIIDDGGSATPSGYRINLNGGVQIPGKIHIRADAIALPSDIPTSVPPPAGARIVNINSAADVNNIGDWATVRDLNVNSPNVTIDVPPGNYGRFTLNSSCRLNFTSGTYNFAQNLHLNGGTSIQATGAVTITVGETMAINGGSILPGQGTGSGNIRLNVLGSSLNLNGVTDVTGLVRAPNSNVHLNGSAKVRGQVIAGTLHLNGGQILGDNAAPAVEITSPASGTTTTEEKIVVSGRASDSGQNSSGIARVYVNDAEAVYNPSTGTWALANFPLAVGANQIVARAVDNFGNQSQAQITVTRQEPPRDTTPPQLAITSPADGLNTQDETITVSGTVSDSEQNASGVASVKVNDVEATRDVLAGTWTLSGVALQTGANTITARAVDNAGNQTTRSITVTRRETPPPDTAPPTVTITSPANNSVTFDSSITVTGTAVDQGTSATGVARVFVNGVEATFDAGSGGWTAAGVALTEGDNRIVAEAEDRAPVKNTGRAEINVRRRIVAPPQLSITNPIAGSVVSSNSITVAGTVSAGDTDIAVTVKVNGEAATIAGGQFTKTVALLEGANTITVEATDSTGQKVTSTVAVVRDQSAPTVAFATVPGTVQAGASYQVRADAQDNVGVAAVEFSVDGQAAATSTSPPYEFTFTVPPTAAPDQIITLTAIARDLASTTAIDSVRVKVAGPGGVSGYVFDDATGFGIEGAAILGATGPVGTDRAGAYNFVSSSPSGLVRLVRSGYTAVERAFAVTSGSGTSLFDARLTKLDSQANQISTSGGTASGDGGRLQVVFGSGVFSSSTDIRVTSISQQGLINLLPFGWSPVPGAVVDVRAADVSIAAGQLASAARLAISSTAGLAEGTPLVVARYDESLHVWIVVATGVSAGANGALGADLTALGQYAFLVADTGATAPPSAAAGQPLPSSSEAESSALEQAQASASSSPRTAIISPDALSQISFIADCPTKLPSGVAIEATFDETYNLLTDTNPLLVDRPAQDFVLYSYPSASSDNPNRLGAFFAAKPTRTDFTLSQLRAANVHIEIRAGRPAAEGVLIGSEGGEVTDESGAKLEIPAGALSSSTPVFIDGVAADASGAQLPAGFEVVGAVDVDVASTVLASSATLSLPAVAGDTARIVVARMVTAGGRRSPKVVARAIESGGRLKSTISSPPVPSGVRLSGVTLSGRYVFIRIQSAFGYATGVVATGGSEGGPQAMARVSVDRTSFIDVTSSDGRYTVIGLTGGANNIEAASLITDATGGAAASLSSQDSVANTNITIASVPIAVQSITPANNATDVVVTTSLTVTFNKPVLAASLTGSSFRLSTASGLPVIGGITVLAGNRVAVFTPASNLVGATQYRVTLTTAVMDLYGNRLQADFQSVFTTAAAVSADNRLKAERIRVSYPNSQGFSTVIIPAGSVPAGSIIVVINNTTGATVTTVAGTGEIRVEILVQVGDEIVVLVRQPDGTEYRVSQSAFRREDGFTTVGRNGGAVTSEDGGSVLMIPKNAISGQAEIKLTPKDL